MYWIFNYFGQGPGISELHLMIRTLTTSNSCPPTAQNWTFQAPENAIEATSQSMLVKSRIASHQDRSLTSIYNAVDQVENGPQLVFL